MDVDTRDLEKLATSQRSEYRLRAAEDPALPERLAAVLAKDKREEVRLATAKRSDLSAEVMLGFAKDHESVICQLLARRRDCPHEVYTELAAQGDSNTMLLLATNPQTPAKALQRVARDADKKVRDALTIHPASTPLVILTAYSWLFYLTVPVIGFALPVTVLTFLPEVGSRPVASALCGSWNRPVVTRLKSRAMKSAGWVVGCRRGDRVESLSGELVWALTIAAYMAMAMILSVVGLLLFARRKRKRGRTSEK